MEKAEIENMQKKDVSEHENFPIDKAKLKDSSSASEQVENFIKHFAQSKLEIQQSLKLCETLEKENIANHFDYVMIKLQRLQKYLADSTECLPSYVVRTSTESLKELQDLITSQQSVFLPKKKFAFKSRSKGSQKTDEIISSNVISDEVDNIYQRTKLQSFGFNDEMGKLLQKNSEDIIGKDIEINNLTDCTVLLFGTPNTVHFSNLKNCKIFIGPVKTSVFIEKCTNCIFVAACQQLRVHGTLRCDFYLHIITKPIIEDCSEIRFAPYALEYGELKNHFVQSGLDKTINNWDDVNDFNWLANTQSPNWVIIPVEERCTWSF